MSQSIPSSDKLQRFERLQKVVEGIAHKMRPADDDMVQCGLEKVWELLIENHAHEDRYVVAAARNAMIDRIRWQKRRQKERALAETFDVPAQQSTDEILPVDLEDLMQLLSGAQRRAVRLRIFEGRTLRETAEIMGLGITPVRNLLRKAKGLLRKELADESEMPPSNVNSSRDQRNSTLETIT